MDEELFEPVEDNEIIGSVLTNYGATQVAKAVESGEKVYISEFAVGDGGGSSYIPSRAQQQLVNEKWRGSISKYAITDHDQTQIYVIGDVPAEVGTFYIREVGIFDDKGGLIAVANFPETLKVKDRTGTIQSLKVTTYVQFTTAVENQIAIVVNPDSVDKLDQELHEFINNLFVADKSDMEKLLGITWDNKEPEEPEPEQPPKEDGNCSCDHCGGSDFQIADKSVIDSWF